jgi:hypothetical protein
MGDGFSGISGRNLAQIVLKGGSRPWPWTSPWILRNMEIGAEELPWLLNHAPVRQGVRHKENTI